MGLVSAFNVSLHCPLLTSTDASDVLRQLGAFQAHEVDPAVALLDEETPIKRLFMLLEMARHGAWRGTGSAEGGPGGRFPANGGSRAWRISRG